MNFGNLLLVVVSSISVTSGSRPRLEDSAPRIVEDPSDLIVSKGEPATLNCKAEARPAPTIEWYKDGERVETDRDDPRSHRMLLPSGALFFLRIVHGRRSKPDEGVYTCVARNYLGEAISRNASLDVAILRDDFRQAPSDVVVAAGEPAVLECVPPRGHPEPVVSWKRNNVRVSAKDDRIAMRGGKLMITHTRKSDAGMYVCVGSNMVGERDSDPAELVVYERPVLVRRPVNQVVMEEETVDFLCEVHGDPPPTIRWRRDEGELPRGRFEIRNGNSLRLFRVREQDEGTYTCTSENSVGKTEASAMLQVHAGPRLPPQISTKPRDQIATQGRSLSFQCGTTGNPPPAIFWQKEGSQMLLFPGQPPSQSGRYSVSMSGELTIADVHPEDSGYYVCQAISVAGSVLTKALLEVEGGPPGRVPPIIRQGPANQTASRGATVQLPCRAVGGASVRIWWEKDGEGLAANRPRVTLTEDGTLLISDLKEVDSGTYTCRVSGVTGESSWSGVLTVREDGISSGSRASEFIQLPGPPQKPIVTEVTKNTVTLTWQSNPHEGGAAVTSYIIEAFSQSVGSTWQTVADHVKQETHTVVGLLPNTVYLFIVRAVNSYGLSDPSPISEPVRTQDGSPTEPGVDHRQVQKELGEVVVYLQKPSVLTPTSARISWTVALQSRYVQGYRVFYRTVGSSWSVRDVEATSENSVVLTDLLTATEYEVKIRPYFNELQGHDSLMVLLRTAEEALSAAPRDVSVVQISNSSSISVSWAPPPLSAQSGVVREYKVWCLGDGLHPEVQLNRTVDGAVRSILLTGLIPGVRYAVAVAAVTGLGVGAQSPEVGLVLAPAPVKKGPSLSDQISGVLVQPAFLSGVGVASWLALMAFSGWFYCRHRRRKQLGHYTTSFNYTPAVGFAHGEGSGIINGGPGLLGSNMGTYPWLADSWPTPSLSHTSKDSETKLDPDRFYNAVGVSVYQNQNQNQFEKRSTASTDSPIYSTINTTADEDLLAYYDTYSSTSYSRGPDPYRQDPDPYSQGPDPYSQGPDPYSQGPDPYSQGPDPYSSNPVLAHSGLVGLDLDLDQWTIKSGQSGSEYAKLQYSKKASDKLVKQRSAASASGSSSRSAPLTWMDVLSLPLPANRVEGHRKSGNGGGEQQSSDDEDDNWCPPLPARTYLMDSSREEVSALVPQIPQVSSQVSGVPQVPQISSQVPQISSQVPQVSGVSSQVSQSNPDLFTNTKVQVPAEAYHTSQWAGDFKGDKGSWSPAGGSSPAHTQRSRTKKKPRDGSVRRDGHTAPPPPPPPPPPDSSLQLLADVLSRKEGSESPSAMRRNANAKWSSQDESGFLPPVQVQVQVQTSGFRSLGGGGSTRGSSTGRRTDQSIM